MADCNLLILVSMVGFLTGVVRSPFTAAILVLEMTDRHAAIFQLLIEARLAQAVAALVDPIRCTNTCGKASCTSRWPKPRPRGRPVPQKPR